MALAARRRRKIAARRAALHHAPGVEDLAERSVEFLGWRHEDLHARQRQRQHRARRASLKVPPAPRTLKRGIACAMISAIAKPTYPRPRVNTLRGTLK